MKQLLLISLVSIFALAGCTVKQAQPSGPSYEQQQQSFDKATQGM